MNPRDVQVKKHQLMAKMTKAKGSDPCPIPALLLEYLKMDQRKRMLLERKEIK
jgi:hypothetical protein